MDIKEDGGGLGLREKISPPFLLYAFYMYNSIALLLSVSSLVQRQN